jgi:hypothetical protein
MKARFNVFEIEKHGDEETSLMDLATAGCTNILVIARDYEDGTIRVECDLPDYVTSPHQLVLEVACL